MSETKFAEKGSTVVVRDIPHVGMQTIENGYPRCFIPHAHRMGLEQGREFVVKACVARQDMHWLWISIDTAEGEAMFPEHYFDLKEE